MDNPFERYDLDPSQGIAEITQRLKELAEDAKTDAEREALRAAWEELTLHPARRLRAALAAHPESRRPLGAPPTSPRARAQGSGDALGLPAEDLVARPSVVAALPDEIRAVPPAPAAPPLDDDPLLA